MPPLNIDQSTAKRIAAGAGAIIVGKAKCTKRYCDFQIEDMYEPDCFLKCNYYEHRFSEGTIYFYQSAKLVHKAKILKSYPVKFEDLTNEIAVQCRYINPKFHPTDNVRDSLIKKYNAKPGDIFQVVEFEKKMII